MSQIDLQPVKGTRDLYPEDMRVRTWLFAHWRDVARSFGFEEYDACVLEHAELFIRKAGDEITGQLYDFRDKGDRHLALRPELTPSLARMVMAKGAALALPARWFSLPQCFRYEETQRGRKREHYQWNMDIVGLASVAAEAELIAAQVEFCRRVGLKVAASDCVGGVEPEVIWKVSSRQVLGHFLDGMGITGDRFAQVCVCIDKRDKIGDAGTTAELAKVGTTPEQAAAILRLLDVRGLDQLAQHVPADNAGLVALRELHELAASFGIDHLIRIDLSVIRGLSYYTGTVWEVFAQVGSIRRAVAGGGRYDKLCEQLGGTAIPMVGFGFGALADVDHAVLADAGTGRGRGHDADRAADVEPVLGRLGADDQAAWQQAIADRGLAAVAAATEALVGQRDAAHLRAAAGNLRVIRVDDAADGHGPVAGLDIDGVCSSAPHQSNAGCQDKLVHLYLLFCISCRANASDGRGRFAKYMPVRPGSVTARSNSPENT